MAPNYADDIRRYQPNINDRALAGIVKHLGIALKSNDASKVSCASKDELVRVRDRWLKKKLGLTDDDAKLDAAIAELCKRMDGDAKKERVTFYYLLAEKFDRLGSIGA